MRRAAVQVLHVAAHNKAVLIQRLLPTLMPLLYQQTLQRPDLVRVVDLGPFKHTVDDGLELRKSAFECLDTLLDSSLACLDAAEFLKHVQVLSRREHCAAASNIRVGVDGWKATRAPERGGVAFGAPRVAPSGAPCTWFLSRRRSVGPRGGDTAT